ncbi:MAG: diguanylate cyclase [Firmicutes bacterium]|nr:diguanylate cyclase [Bacillota bacterium]
MIGKINKSKIAVLILIITILLSYLSICFVYSDNDCGDSFLFLGNKNVAPVVYEENGVAKGVMVDITKALCKKAGCNVEIKAMNWEEAQKKVELGEADAIIHINPSPEREEVFDFSDIILKSEFCIFKKSGNNYINNVADLKDKEVGVEVGGYPYHLLKSYYGINIVTIKNWYTGFEMIESGDLDAIVVDKWVGEYELAKNRIKGIVIAEDPIEIRYSRIAVKKGNEELLNKINTGLKKIKSDGSMTEIIDKWQGKKVVYYTEEGIRNTVLYGIIFVLIIFLSLTIYWIMSFKKLNKSLEQSVVKRTRELNDANEKLRRVNEELEKISAIDGLTSIPNRRCFDETFTKEWGISKREKQPLALIMIDIDKFKIFNDTYGHLTGDECLKIVAKVIKNSLKRPGDFIARFGGEEFVVLLYNTTEEGATIIAEEIRKSIEDLGIENKGIDSVITVSLGVAAVIPSKSNEPQDLINLADRAMYKAKELGRNMVVNASSIV